MEDILKPESSVQMEAQREENCDDEQQEKIPESSVEVEELREIPDAFSCEKKKLSPSSVS